MENKGLRKRKTVEATKQDIDKEVKKKCNDFQKRDRRLRQNVTRKSVKQSKPVDDKIKATNDTSNARRISKTDISNKRGTEKNVGTSKIYIKRGKNTKKSPSRKEPKLLAKERGTKAKTENVSCSHSSKGEETFQENKAIIQKYTDKVVNPRKHFEILKNENVKFQKDSKVFEAEKNQFNEELQERNKDIELLSQTKSFLETELLNVKKVNEEQCRHIASLELNLKKANSYNEKLRTELIQKDQIKKSEMTKLENEVAELKRDNICLQNKLRKFKRQIQESEPNPTIKADISDSKAFHPPRGDRFQEGISESDKHLIALQPDREEHKIISDIREQELGQFKQIKPIQIQLFHCSSVPLVSRVEEELKDLLKNEMENNVTKLEFIECASDTETMSEAPLLIMCISASRLGTDALNAIRDLNVTSKMALLVFHYKDEHALPHQASEQVLTGNVFRRIGGIFDFGFLSSRGIYSCQLNDQSLKSVVNFINKERQKVYA